MYLCTHEDVSHLYAKTLENVNVYLRYVVVLTIHHHTKHWAKKLEDSCSLFQKNETTELPLGYYSLIKIWILYFNRLTNISCVN